MKLINCLSTSWAIHLILVMLLCLILSAGCFPVTPDEPEPVIPVLSVDVDLGNWESGCIYYTIENDGDVDVNYELIFVVDLYGHVDIVLVEESDEILEVGDLLSKCVKIECPNCGTDGWEIEDILSVDVTYELWE